MSDLPAAGRCEAAARTHASRDRAAWKYFHVGNYLLNHVYPPNHGQV